MPGPSSSPTHRGFIFSHEGDQRVAATITMAGIIAVLLGGVFMAIGPPLKTNAGAARQASGESAAVRVVGAAARQEISCEQQTWPHIDQRCLVRSKSESAENPSPAAQDNTKLSPLTATGKAVGPAPVTSDVGPPTNPVAQQQEAENAPVRPEAAAGYASNDAEEMQPQRPAEPVRKRTRRHSGFFPFPFRF